MKKITFLLCTLLAQQCMGAAFPRHIASLQQLCRKAIIKNIALTQDAMEKLGDAHPESGELFAQCVNNALLKMIPLQSQKLSGHTDSVQSVSFSGDGNILLSGSFDKTIRFWDVATGKCFKQFTSDSPIYATAFSPDYTKVISGSGNGTIQVWDLVKNTVVATLKIHDKAIKSVTFSPDGTLFAASSMHEHAVYWGDAATLTINHRVTLSATLFPIVFNPDGTTIAFPIWNGRVYLYNVASGEQKKCLINYGVTPIRSIAFSPDGTMLAGGSSDEGIYIWNVKTGVCTRLSYGHRDAISEIAYTPDGSTLIAGDFTNIVQVWDIASRKLTSLRGHTNWIRSVACSPDGRFFASGSDDKTVRIWRGYQQELLEITDPAERAFLLNTAERWLANMRILISAYVSCEGSSTTSDRNAHDPIYQALIKRFAFLNMTKDYLFIL